MTLDQAAHEEPVRILKVTASAQERIRILDLGFVPGTKIVRVASSIMGDPVAYAVRGTVIALRKSQAQTIEVAPW